MSFYCFTINFIIYCPIILFCIMYKLIAFTLFFSLFSFSQNKPSSQDVTLDEESKNYFAYPLKIPIQLSGTFGELRNNHFHAGVDVKTQQREGIPIYAAADGYVNRIKVAHFGYGKALYLQHPNGYATVYAHLQKYAGKIQDFVLKTQYLKESYEFEIFPEANVLPVKKGEIIGYTGNTGSSGGPHLHYEIRDRASRPMNPKLFGFEVEDTRKPLINSVFVYPMGEESHVNQNQNLQQLRLIPTNDGNYITEKIKASGTLGFGISAVDQQNAANNRNGLYQIKTQWNGQASLQITFDKFSFQETRYLNRFIDYGYFKENKSKIQKLFIEKNNPLSIFKSSNKNGFIVVQDSLDGVYTIEVSDFQNNNVHITIPIQGVQLPIETPLSKPKYNYSIFANEGATIKEGIFTINIPPKSLYEDAYLNVKSEGSNLHFHENNIPIHTNITITADVSNFKHSEIDKVFIGKLNYKGEPYYKPTQVSGNTTISTRVREFGSYGLGIDTLSPQITPLNFSDQQWISNNKTLELKIEDTQSGIKNYRATINGKWILMEYEYKNDRLTYHFDELSVLETENNFRLIVTDNVGNSSKFEATFYRK